MASSRTVGEGDGSRHHQTITVEMGTSPEGFVVYGSPAKPKHTTLAKIRKAVLSLSKA
jgi:hypothetical protein